MSGRSASIRPRRCGRPPPRPPAFEPVHLLEDPRRLAPRQRLVLDDERAHFGSATALQVAPGWNRSVTEKPDPGADDPPRAPRRAVLRAAADAPARGPARPGAIASFPPGPSSAPDFQQLRSRPPARSQTVPPAARGAMPWRMAFSTSGCSLNAGTGRSRPRRPRRLDAAALAQTQPLEREVARTKLHSSPGAPPAVLPARPARSAAGAERLSASSARRVVPHQGEQRVQRVEQEVRVELRTQRLQLGAGLELGEPRQPRLLVAQADDERGGVGEAGEERVEEEADEELPGGHPHVVGAARPGALAHPVGDLEEAPRAGDREAGVEESEPGVDGEEARAAGAVVPQAAARRAAGPPTPSSAGGSTLAAAARRARAGSSARP